MISIHNLTKAYQEKVVLNVPELDIPQGECFGLVGNNGAGKTTLFSLLLDLIRPSSGEVRLKGEVVAGSDHWKSFTGAYLDENFLIDFLTPEEYFEFVGKLYNMNKADVHDFLQSLEESMFHGEILGHQKYIRDLSKGNKKKVGIAAALLSKPEILILDEPFANLDPSSQIKLKQLINTLDDEMTILVSSHDLTHVTEVCERIVVLDHGEMVKDLRTESQTLEELEAYFSGGSVVGERDR